MIVLDASALLAFLLQEAGHDVVAAHLPQSYMSTVNLSETLARMARRGTDPRQLKPQIDKTGLRLVDFDPSQAVVVSELRQQMRNAGLGIADCCCLGLGLHLALPVLTADRQWATLSVGVTVQLIR